MIYDMAKVTVTLYMDEEDKEALQQLADAEDRSLSQMAVLILKRATKQAKLEGKILPSQSKRDE
jgi:predicted transcriptional regulator